MHNPEEDEEKSWRTNREMARDGSVWPKTNPSSAQGWPGNVAGNRKVRAVWRGRIPRGDPARAGNLRCVTCDFTGLNNEIRRGKGKSRYRAREIVLGKGGRETILEEEERNAARDREREEGGEDEDRYKNGERRERKREKGGGNADGRRRRNRKWNKNEGSYRWRSDLSFDSTLVEKLHLSPAAFGLRIRYGAARKGAPGAPLREIRYYVKRF